jgi:hypothetical protein
MARALKSFGAVVSVCYILGSGSPALAYVATSFYVVAHQDDWQLFMTPSAYDDVRTPNTKVVFIYTTAGDGGNGTGALNRTIPYYIAREEGALRAVQFAATTGFGNQETPVKATINTHTIMRSTYLNTISYFFRLPGGAFDGNGYPGTGYQSFKRLREGRIAQMRTITGDATYVGWKDLVNTIRKIITTEAHGSPIVSVHVPELGTTINPNDHADHRYTALAVRDALQNELCIDWVYHIDYAIKAKARNLSATAADIKAGVWGVTNSGIIDFNHETTWEPNHNVWLGREYFRRVAGAGDCNF